MTQTPPADPQAGDAGNEPQPQAGTTSTEPQAGDSHNEPISLEEAKKLRSEANSLRQRLRNAEARAKEFDDFKAQQETAKLTETERWQKQATELQSKYDSDTVALTERIVRYEVERQAAKLGIIDPDAAAQLIDWDTLEYDEDGTPKNADTLLKDLLKSKPYLAGKIAQTAGGATNPGRASANTAQLSWDIITKMTPEQYEARRAEIQQWMRTAPMKRF